MSWEELSAKRSQILALASRHHASNVRVFGSVARGEDRADSDVDMLVSFSQGGSLLDLVALKEDLEGLLGKRVDIVTDGGLSPYLRDRILAEARPV